MELTFREDSFGVDTGFGYLNPRVLFPKRQTTQALNRAP